MRNKGKSPAGLRSASRRSSAKMSQAWQDRRALDVKCGYGAAVQRATVLRQVDIAVRLVTLKCFVAAWCGTHCRDASLLAQGFRRRKAFRVASFSMTVLECFKVKPTGIYEMGMGCRFFLKFLQIS
jgi:hypothetical protein